MLRIGLRPRSQCVRRLMAACSTSDRSPTTGYGASRGLSHSTLGSDSSCSTEIYRLQKIYNSCLYNSFLASPRD